MCDRADKQKGSSQNGYGQREGNFDNAKLGYLLSLVSGARSAEKILLLQPWRAQRGEKFCNARLDHSFPLIPGARSAENILLLQPWRAQRGENFAFATLARAARRKILQR